MYKNLVVNTCEISTDPAEKNITEKNKEGKARRRSNKRRQKRWKANIKKGQNEVYCDR